MTNSYNDQNHSDKEREPVQTNASVNPFMDSSASGSGTEDDNPYRSPTSLEPVYTKRQQPNIYNSIGGWLVLPAIGLFLVPVLRVILIIQDIGTLVNVQIANAGVIALIYFEIVANILLLAWGLWAAILFFTRKAAAPRAMIILYSSFIFYCLFETIAVACLSLPDNSLLMETQGELGKTIIVGGIWITYFCVSKRVKGTFVR